MSNIFVNRKTFDEVMIPIFSPEEFIPLKGKGSKVWDTFGRNYIDFTGGIAVTALGHCNSKIIKIIKNQSTMLWHIGNYYTNEPVLRLAKRLINLTFADCAFFTNSGAEANETALKLARLVSFNQFSYKKYEIISFIKSFHGRTFFTMNVSGKLKYSKNFGPMPKGLKYLPFNNIECAKQSIGKQTCAVIVEQIQGRGGVIPADIVFLKTLRELCDEHNALLIFDEIQTGIGRTGYFYAYHNTKVVPDILTTAKALGNGFPIGAILTTKNIGSHFKIEMHGTTYGGNPLAAAVAEKVVEIISNKNLLNGVKLREKLIKNKLFEINAKFNIFNEIRGMGLLIGAELSDKYKNKAKYFISAANKNGLMILNAGPNVLRFTPSLIIPKNDINEGFIRLEKSINDVLDKI